MCVCGVCVRCADGLHGSSSDDHGPALLDDLCEVNCGVQQEKLQTALRKTCWRRKENYV